MRDIAALCLGASVAMFTIGYPFGIFRASRLLGLSLRETALNLFFAGCIALALLVGTSPWKGVVNRPLLQFFGEISYGVYLIHMLVFDLEAHFVTGSVPNLSATGGHFALMVLHFTIVVVFTVAVAYLSRTYFEEPFLRLKRRFEKPATRSSDAVELTYSETA